MSQQRTLEPSFMIDRKIVELSYQWSAGRASVLAQSSRDPPTDALHKLNRATMLSKIRQSGILWSI